VRDNIRCGYVLATKLVKVCENVRQADSHCEHMASYFVFYAADLYGFLWIRLVHFWFKREEVLGSRVSVPKSPLLFISNELILTFLLLNSNQLQTSFKQPSLTPAHSSL
jgi:hypothetical protein